MLGEPAAESLSFPGAPHDLLARDQRNTFYASLIRRNFMLGSESILDPDIVLEQDPEAYGKMLAELGIASKLEKRAQRVSSAGWLFLTPDPGLEPLVPLFTRALSNIKGFYRARKALALNGALKGWATARIFGEFRNMHMPGDLMERRWWLPTRLVDVAKERWRVERETPQRIAEGHPKYYWTVQDIFDFMWYRVDDPFAPAGLRRMDYVWARKSDSEDDLTYSHGLGRALYHKWYMLSFAWIYALDGAESWSKGKVVMKTPNTFGGASLPGDLQGQRKAQKIRDDLANAAAKQMSRHVLVLDSTQDFEVFGQPTSGHEAVQWIIEEIYEECSELILGVSRRDNNQKFDIDPDIVNDDKDMLETAINEDLVSAFVAFNTPNFLAMGYTPDDLRALKYSIKRDSGLDPEAVGKSLQIATSLGAPVHRDDIYEGLRLTKVERDDPNAIFAPPPGSPVSGTMQEVTAPQPPPTPAPPAPPGAPGPGLLGSEP